MKLMEYEEWEVLKDCLERLKKVEGYEVGYTEKNGCISIELAFKDDDKVNLVGKLTKRKLNDQVRKVRFVGMIETFENIIETNQ